MLPSIFKCDSEATFTRETQRGHHRPRFVLLSSVGMKRLPRNFPEGLGGGEVGAVGSVCGLSLEWGDRPGLPTARSFR